MLRLALLFGLLATACTASGVKISESSEASVRGEELDAGLDAGIDAGPAMGPSWDSGLPTEPDGVVVDAGSRELEDSGPRSCYRDGDGDGIGSGDAVSCDSTTLVPDGGLQASDAAEPDVTVRIAGDCDDADSARAPGLKERCDALDNDCDDDVDEGVMNECGGVCIVPFEHRPGDDCENGLLGACARTGSYACQGSNSVVCNAPAPTPSAELCSDSVDNDCDGSINEADAADAQSWYQDCDRDGYAASTDGALRSCKKPADAGSCSWTAVVPQANTKTNWDCDDSRAQYKPGAAFGVPPPGANSFDLNCDGVTEKENKIRDSGIERWLCPASENGAYCSYWTSPSGANLSTQPACSATTSATYPADKVSCPDPYGSCVEVPFQGTQYCR